MQSDELSGLGPLPAQDCRLAARKRSSAHHSTETLPRRETGSRFSGWIFPYPRRDARDDPQTHRGTPRQSGALPVRGDRGRPLPAVAAGEPAQGAAGEDRPEACAGRGAVASAEVVGSAELRVGEEAAAVAWG